MQRFWRCFWTAKEDNTGEFGFGGGDGGDGERFGGGEDEGDEFL